MVVKKKEYMSELENLNTDTIEASEPSLDAITNTLRKKRGVLKGTKRGSYKKNKIQSNEVANEQANNSSEGDIVTNNDNSANANLGSSSSSSSSSINFDKLKASYINDQDNSEGNDVGGDENVNEVHSENTAPHIEISGKMFLALIDTACPIAANLIVKFATKGKKHISIQGLRLTPEEKEILEPLSDAAAQEILGTLKPTHLFLLALASIYGGKVMEQIKDNPNYIPKVKRKAGVRLPVDNSIK